jgi:hypothetical protein
VTPPAIIAPPELTMPLPSQASPTLVHEDHNTASDGWSVNLVFYSETRQTVEPHHDVELGAPEIPGGIDYDRWTENISPASRSAFRDSSDLLDFEDDD